MIKDFKDFEEFKLLGKVREPTGEPYMYRTVYRYTEEQMAPLWNFVAKHLSKDSKKSNHD